MHKCTRNQCVLLAYGQLVAGAWRKKEQFGDRHYKGIGIALLLRKRKHCKHTIAYGTHKA
jgi:hypothetical protein